MAGDVKTGYWLFKQEPGSYSYADLERDGRTVWDGVANALARKHLRAIRPGDRVLYYHTGSEKAVVGEMRVVGGPRPESDDDPNAVVVTVKPAAFKRCLGNLISNAARHAKSIAITGHRDHRYLTVTIDDDGPGIPAASRGEVVKPFLRLDDARNQDEGGTGLGLAIARDIARSHGGDITLGDSPMGGLRATVRVPV